MSTDDLDARLAAAGERWRAANTTVADVDLDYLEIPAEPVESAAPVDIPVTASREDAHAPSRRRRIRIRLASAAGVAAAVAATVIAVSLSSGSSPAHKHQPGSIGASGLVGVDWRLVQVDGKAGTPAVADARFTIDDKGQLKGSDGCNSLGAQVTINADTINLGSVITTDMACVNTDPQFAAQVARLDTVLSGTLQWSVQGDELTLSRNGTPVLVYRAAPPPTTDPTAVVGIGWRLVAVAQAGANSSSTSSVGPDVALKFDGTAGFTASDGCNSGGGKVTITAAKMVFSNYVSTKIACPDVDPAQTRTVAKVFDGEVSWAIKDGQLTITKAGVGSLSYASSSALPTTGSS